MVKLLLAMMVLGVVKAGRDGFFEYMEGGKPCHSSGKTGSTDGQGDTGEDFMLMDTATQLCKHGDSGDYFDQTVKRGRSGEGTCDGYCAYQDGGLAGAPGTKLDLDTLECVSECKESQILLSGAKVRNMEAGRTLEYYLDHDSTQVLELGTRQYPYRTIKSFVSEILAFVSHSDINVTLYLKDAYIKDGDFNFVNITNIILDSHPDYLSSRRAVITPTKFEQDGISIKSLFHLMENLDNNFSSVIDSGNFTSPEYYYVGLSTEYSDNYLLRTGMHFTNVDLTREPIDIGVDSHFLIPIFLQKLTLNFSKLEK